MSRQRRTGPRRSAAHRPRRQTDGTVSNGSVPSQAGQPAPAAGVIVGLLMSEPQAVVGEFDSAVLAAQRMLSVGVPAVAVCGPGNRFVGMVSDRDILEWVVAAGRDPQLVLAAALVGSDRPMIVPDRPVDRSVLAMLLRQRLALLPVVHDGRLLGLLSLADVTDHLLEEADRGAFPGELDAWWPDPPAGHDIGATPDSP